MKMKTYAIWIRVVLSLLIVVVIGCSGGGKTNDPEGGGVKPAENAPPIFAGTNLDNKTYILNQPIDAFRTNFSDPDSETLKYGIEGKWPLGLSVNENTGEISGTPFELGQYPGLRITASDKTSTARSNSFLVTVEERALSGRFTVDVMPDIQLADDQETSDRWQRDILGLMTDAIEPLNRIVSLPTDVAVTVRNCENPSAFYNPSTNSITLCWELFWAAAISLDERFDDMQTAVNFAALAYNFILYHEASHALDVQLGLPIAGNFESAADGIATVLSVEQFSKYGSQYPVVAALLFETNDGGSFGDVHPGSADRAGDILCAALGGDSRLAFISFFVPYVQLFADAGRDCVSEYAGRKSAVESWLPNLAELDAQPEGKQSSDSIVLSENSEEMRSLAILLERSGLYEKLSAKINQ